MFGSNSGTAGWSMIQPSSRTSDLETFVDGRISKQISAKSGFVLALNFEIRRALTVFGLSLLPAGEVVPLGYQSAVYNLCQVLRL